jgi:hypothetical protein
MLYFKQVCADLENFNFTFIDAEDCTASGKWQKIFIRFLIIAPFLSVNVAQQWSTRQETHKSLDRSRPVQFSFLKAWRVKRKTFMRFFH